MSASIIFDQSGKSAGVAGKSREDFDSGSVVTCSNSTTESTYLWTLEDVPIRSGLTRGTTGSSSTFTFTPDVPGTYRVSLRVNGSTLATDNQTRFCAVLTSAAKTLGWRYLAAGEQGDEDNIDRAGLGFPGDTNVRGWATERDLQLEQIEEATWEVINAVVSSPGAGSDNLVRLNTVTGTLDPSVLPINTSDVQIVGSTVGGWSVSSGVGLNVIMYSTGADSADLADNGSMNTAQDVVGVVVDKPTSTTATIAHEGEVSGFSGLTPDAIYYLGTTGGITDTPLDPNANPGKVHLRVGVAKNSTTLVLHLGEPIEL